jgi:hypothetical protein
MRAAHCVCTACFAPQSQSQCDPGTVRLAEVLTTWLTVAERGVETVTAEVLTTWLTVAERGVETG